jgi:hypothetical protein
MEYVSRRNKLFKNTWNFHKVVEPIFYEEYTAGKILGMVHKTKRCNE